MIPKLNTFEIQEGKLGRKFKSVAILKGENHPKWINRVEKYHWIHVFKYVDDDSLFAIELDYTGTLIKVVKNYEFT